LTRGRAEAPRRPVPKPSPRPHHATPRGHPAPVPSPARREGKHPRPVEMQYRTYVLIGNRPHPRPPPRYQARRRRRGVQPLRGEAVQGAGGTRLQPGQGQRAEARAAWTEKTVCSEERVDPTLEGRALQDALRRGIATASPAQTPRPRRGEIASSQVIHPSARCSATTLVIDECLECRARNMTFDRCAPHATAAD